jgi:uncharacterized protein
MEQDQQFVEMIVREIVSNPDDVRTERTVDEMGVLITLHINSEDMGYVIGRQGQTARAIRTLLKIVGAKNNARVNLKIYEPEGSRPPRKRREESTAATMDTAPEARSESTDDLLGTDMPDINI